MVLIAARPGIMRNSLVSYLRGIPGIHAIFPVDDAITALQVARDSKPKFAVLDSDLSEDAVLRLIEKIHNEQPETVSIVLVESIRQKELCTSRGAAHVLLKGLLDEHLREVVLSELRTTQSREAMQRRNT